MTCGCVLSASGFNHYHLIFEGKKDPYDEGKLTCSANCAPLPVDGAICKPLIFAGSGASMHVFRTAIVASMSGIIALISADFS